MPARTRREETAVLHQRARQATEDIDGAPPWSSTRSEATAEVQEHFGAAIEAEALVQTEVRSSAGSAVAVSSAVAVARGKFSEISALAHDIGRLGHQTTLLSLNAAVVAATAGAEGKTICSHRRVDSGTGPRDRGTGQEDRHDDPGSRALSQRDGHGD